MSNIEYYVKDYQHLNNMDFVTEGSAIYRAIELYRNYLISHELKQTEIVEDLNTLFFRGYIRNVCSIHKVIIPWDGEDDE